MACTQSIYIVKKLCGHTIGSYEPAIFSRPVILLLRPNPRGKFSTDVLSFNQPSTTYYRLSSGVLSPTSRLKLVASATLCLSLLFLHRLTFKGTYPGLLAPEHQKTFKPLVRGVLLLVYRYTPHIRKELGVYRNTSVNQICYRIILHRKGRLSVISHALAK